MIDLEDAYESYLDAQHFESEHKAQTKQHRRARRERRELEKARKAVRK